MYLKKFNYKQKYNYYNKVRSINPYFTFLLFMIAQLFPAFHLYNLKFEYQCQLFYLPHKKYRDVSLCQSSCPNLANCQWEFVKKSLFFSKILDSYCINPLTHVPIDMGIVYIFLKFDQKSSVDISKIDVPKFSAKLLKLTFRICYLVAII